MVVVASIFHVGRDPRNKIKQDSFITGEGVGGVHGGSIEHMEYYYNETNAVLYGHVEKATAS